MDHQVLYSIRTIANGDTKNVKLLSAFLPEGWPVDVPDPMRRSVSVCNRVLDMLETACDAMFVGLVVGRRRQPKNSH